VGDLSAASGKLRMRAENALKRQTERSCV
jgi:hypothetical protein